MSRGWKAGLGVGAFVVALNVALTLIHSLGGGTPGGPTSSSYATAPTGAAAYASLLGRAGHRVERLRGRPSAERLDPAATVVLLDPARPVAAEDGVALRRFVAAGGRLVLGGATGAWLDRIVPGAPDWSPTPSGAVRSLAPAPQLARVHELEPEDRGSWVGGSALPLLGDTDRTLLALAAVGTGRVWLLADASPLQNRLLDRADDAALGLALAGPAPRRVVFLERYHGYGAAATGFAAVPDRWWTAFGLLALATLVLMIASGRRFGPPLATERELPPPRREYVEALGSVLARSRSRDASIEPVRARVREVIAARAGLGRNPSDDELRAAAILLGVPADQAAALARPAASDADVLAVGHILARVERESQP
jgi:hypothetical protein